MFRPQLTRRKAAVAAPPAHTAAGPLDEPAEPIPADDSSVWVPIASWRKSVWGHVVVCFVCCFCQLVGFAC